jgi:hypothetical protein
MMDVVRAPSAIYLVVPNIFFWKAIISGKSSVTVYLVIFKRW